MESTRKSKMNRLIKYLNQKALEFELNKFPQMANVYRTRADTLKKRMFKHELTRHNSSI